MIEAVTFDWWDTMALTTEEQDEQLRELRIERLAKAVPDLPRTREALLQAYDRQQAILEEAWARNVDPAPEDQIQTFLTFAGLDQRDAVLVERVSEAFGGALLEIPPALFPHVPETLEELEREGVAIGLVSNTGRTWGRYIAAPCPARVGDEADRDAFAFQFLQRLRDMREQRRRDLQEGAAERLGHAFDEDRVPLVQARERQERLDLIFGSRVDVPGPCLLEDGLLTIVRLEEGLPGPREVWDGLREPLDPELPELFVLLLRREGHRVPPVEGHRLDHFGPLDVEDDLGDSSFRIDGELVPGHGLDHELQLVPRLVDRLAPRATL